MDLGQVFTDRTVAEYMVSMFHLEKDALSEISNYPK